MKNAGLSASPNASAWKKRILFFLAMSLPLMEWFRASPSIHRMEMNALLLAAILEIVALLGTVVILGAKNSLLDGDYDLNQG